jgi:hypothetical protein
MTQLIVIKEVFSEAVEAIKILSPILNRVENRSSLKIIKDLVILPIINILAPSIREKIFLALGLSTMFLAYILKTLKLEHLILSYVALAIFLTYFILNIVGISKNTPKPTNSNALYSSRLTNSILGKRKMRLESALEPEVSDFEIHEIEGKLFNLSSIQIDECMALPARVCLADSKMPAY